MLGRKKILLKTLINKQFSTGINKVDLFDALETFIEENYPEANPAVYMSHSKKTQILQDLAFDIRQAGGLEIWKKQLVLLSTPVLGSLPPDKKK